MSIGSTSNQVSKYTSTIKDLANSTNDLGKALKYVDEFGKLSKFSAGLGMVGAGFAIIGILSGEETDTEKILNAIDKLSDQVTELGDRMDAQFSRLEAVVQETAAKTQITPAVAFFNGLQNHINGLKKTSDRNSQTAISYRNSIRTYTVDQITTHAESIVLTMADSQFANNILESSYNTTSGDIKIINALAGGLMSYLVFAAEAHGIVLSLGTSEEEMKNFPSNIIETNSQIVENIHSKGLIDAQKAWKSIINKCVSSMNSNVDKKTRYLIDNAPNRSDHEQTAVYLKDQLKDQFFWNDWITIVYNDVSGYNTHAMWGWNYKAIFRYRGINVVVKWVDKNITTSNRGKKRPDGIDFSMSFPNAFGNLPPITASAEQMDWSGNNMGELGKTQLKTPLKSPGFIWRCDRKKGVYAAWSNSNRVIWKNGKITFCLFE